MKSPGKIWWQFSRDVRRGWDATYHDYQTLPRIEEWYWPFWGEEPASVPVHVLTGAKDWRLAGWSLASLFHFSELAWPVVIHDDGTLDDEGRGVLEALFEGCRIISRAEADAVMNRLLRAYPFCADYRAAHPLALKIFDMAQFAENERFIVLDSDVLFFSHPREIIDWANGRNTRECWFNEDAQESSIITAAEAREELDVRLWGRVNSGLGLLQRGVIDLDFCDRALALTSILRGRPEQIEQTLFALCASRQGKGGLLPKTYEVSLKRRATPDIIARHYTGPVRDRFYGEGLKRLAGELLAVEDD
jgi:hypothetical protein